jgi:protease IV
VNFCRLIIRITSMKSFLKYTLATIFGVFISFIFIGVLLFFTLLGLINSGTEGKVSVKSNSVLELNLDYEIQERGSQAFLSLLNPEMGESFLGLDNLLEIINRAKNDPKIKGIYLKTNLNNSGYATLSEVRNALKDFKSKGKFIYAMAPYYDEKNYYLASIADSVFIEKTGNILLNGLSANVMFYKGAFEKLGIEMQYVKVGAYKGAIESFTREELSPENREQISFYIHQLYHNLIAEIGESRQVDTHQLRMAIDQFTIQSPKDAFNFGLIDGLTYQDDVHNKIRKAIGSKDSKNKHYIKASSYLNSGESEKTHRATKLQWCMR